MQVQIKNHNVIFGILQIPFNKDNTLKAYKKLSFHLKHVAKVQTDQIGCCLISI